MELGQNGLDLIKKFEGCRTTAYRDQVGIWTIGYGHTGPEVCQGLVWTQEQCDDQLQKDIDDRTGEVNRLMGTAIPTQGQFDAMFSFAYNLGMSALKRSHLLAKFIDGDIQDAADEFLKWDMAGGQVDPGLERRRQAERTLFLS